MAKTRVYELAKTLNITNKMLLTKMKELNIEVGSHMSSLDQKTIDTIKASIYGKTAPEHDEKRVKKTVIRRRKRTSDDTLTDEDYDDDLDTDSAETEADEPVNESDAQESSAEQKEISEASDAKEPGSAEAEKPKEKSESPAVNERLKPRSTTRAKIIFSPEAVTEQEPKEEKGKTDTEELRGESPTADEVVSVKTSDLEKNGTPDQESQALEKDVPEKATRETEISGEASKSQVDLKQEDKLEQQEESADDKTDGDDVTAGKVDEEADLISGQPKKKKSKKFTAAKIIKLPEKKAAAQDIPESATKQKAYVPEPEDVKIVATPASVESDEDPVLPKKGKKGKKALRVEDDSEFTRKKSKRKTVVEGNALYSEGRGRKGRKGGKKGSRQKPAEGQKTQITTPKAIKRRIKIDETINLSELAKRMGIKANDMIVKLMGLGVMATVNQTIDYDTAALVASEFGFEVEQAAFAEDTILNIQDESNPEAFRERPPVVTIMGHVDHGKTSLLDVIRKSSVTTGEAGGITQHIGAYNVSTTNGQIVFLDTPGHEAFTAMRSRGASVTDIVVLVVAADDGVMPQTVEALNHAKAAGVPIIVAVNKIDKEGADPDRVKRELSDHGILAEDWGGDAMFVHVSAKQKIGIEDLLEMILLQSEMLELKADPIRFAKGHVVEAKLDSGRGPIATILVQAGTLKAGQSVVCGIHYGKIRAMFNDKGEAVQEAGPSIPVEIIGLTGVPEAGDELIAVSEEKSAKQVSAHRMQKARAKELAQSTRMSLESLFEQIEDGEVKDLNLIIKADVHGSIEALKESLGKLSTNEVKINVVHSATGTVTESDVSLASVSNAIILGFNVRPETKVRNMAKEESVDMRFYDIIYDAIKDLKDAMVGMMESTFEEKVLGIAEVIDTFFIPKKGTVAGCIVREGKIIRGERVRLLRDGVIIFDGNISSLKRYKDDAKEVTHGYECGIGIENFNDVKVGDKIDCYMFEEIKPTML